MLSKDFIQLYARHKVLMSEISGKHAILDVDDLGLRRIKPKVISRIRIFKFLTLSITHDCIAGANNDTVSQYL